MSTDSGWLALRLEGPLQAWGFDSQYNRRSTGLMPTRSGIAGMCCAALGADRGSAEEGLILADFAGLVMTAIAIPRQVRGRVLEVRRVQDYHTVLGTRKAEGGVKDCHITHRFYLADAAFGVLLNGDPAFLDRLAAGLRDPHWCLFLGRKACIPTAPVLVGRFDALDQAWRGLVGDRSPSAFTRQEEVDTFADGRDSLPDRPVSFLGSRREFAPRRIRIIQGTACASNPTPSP